MAIQSVGKILGVINPQQNAPKQPLMQSLDQNRLNLLRDSLKKLAHWKLIGTPTPELYESWLSALTDIPNENIRIGVEKAKNIGSDYFTLPVFIELCKISAEDIGLPSFEIAYHEACTANSVRSFPWSHPAVYHSAMDTGIFDLRNNVDGNKRRFKDHYEKRCQQVLSGEVLKIPNQELLPEKVDRKLSKAENLARLAKLRAMMKTERGA